MLLSIIIPVYQLEKHIVRTLNSFVKDLDDQIEVILIDDGSTDDSAQIISGYINDHNNLNLCLYTTKNAGVSAARNFGMSKAQGKYLLYLDGDDLLSNGSVCRIKDCLQEDNPDIIFWPYDVVNEQGVCLRKYPFPKPEIITMSGVSALRAVLLNKSMYVVIGSAAYKRRMLIDEKLQFHEGCVAGEDMEFTLSALSRAKTVKPCPDALLQYVQRENSAIHRYNIRRFDSVAALRRASVLIKESTNKDVWQLASLVSGQEVLINYMGTYRMCLEQKARGDRLSLKSAKKSLDEDIKKYYPGLQENIKTILNQTRKYFPIHRSRIFNISPILYMYIAKYKERANKYKSNFQSKKHHS